MSAPERTPQAIRSARTRSRLLDATVECVAELGYARATTTEIARRAGVSRGAQLHHFPTKAELVAAAVEHTLSQRMEQLRQSLDSAPPDADKIQLSIDGMWAMFQGPACIAWIELAVAARTDEELRPHVAAAGERHRQAAEAMFREVYPEGNGDNPFYASALKFLLALFDGLVLHRMSGYDEAPGRSEAVVEAAKGLAAMIFPPPR